MSELCSIQICAAPLRAVPVTNLHIELRASRQLIKQTNDDTHIYLYKALHPCVCVCVCVCVTFFSNQVINSVFQLWDQIETWDYDDGEEEVDNEVENNNKDDNNYKEDNNDKGISVLGLDEVLGFLRGHQGHQPPDDDEEEEDDNKVEGKDKVEDNNKDDDNYKDDNNDKGTKLSISTLGLNQTIRNQTKARVSQL